MKTNDTITPTSLQNDAYRTSGAGVNSANVWSPPGLRLGWISIGYSHESDSSCIAETRTDNKRLSSEEEVKIPESGLIKVRVLTEIQSCSCTQRIFHTWKSWLIQGYRFIYYIWNEHWKSIPWGRCWMGDFARSHWSTQVFITHGDIQMQRSCAWRISARGLFFSVYRPHKFTKRNNRLMISCNSQHYVMFVRSADVFYLSETRYSAWKELCCTIGHSAAWKPSYSTINKYDSARFDLWQWSRVPSLPCFFFFVINKNVSIWGAM